ncbi:hypothetical protein ACFL4G_03700 [Thermodesulfobacteriota bacterium]
MKGHGAKFDRKKEGAIAALLEQPSIQAAAKQVGIGEVTLWRWLQEKEFQTEYREARRRVVDQAISRLQNATGEAVETLREIMLDKDKPASARVTAARTILDTAIQATEIGELEGRLAELEERLEAKQ